MAYIPSIFKLRRVKISMISHSKISKAPTALFTGNTVDVGPVSTRENRVTNGPFA